jgi:hypothetical protein
MTSFVAAETDVVKFLEANKVWCGVPDAAINASKANHEKSIKFRTAACSEEAPRPKAPSLSDAITRRVPSPHIIPVICAAATALNIGKLLISAQVLDLSRISPHELRRLRIGGVQNIGVAPTADGGGITALSINLDGDE